MIPLMDVPQIATNALPATTVTSGMADDETIVIMTLEPKHMMWIDFCALGGMMTDDEGNIKLMTINDFADKITVDRTTLNRWKTRIPNFWELVKKRRIELSKNSRASKVYNGLFLKAAQGETSAVRLWAELFDGYQPAAQKHDVRITGLGDLVNIARKKRVIEAEVVQPSSGTQ